MARSLAWGPAVAYTRELGSRSGTGKARGCHAEAGGDRQWFPRPGRGARLAVPPLCLEAAAARARPGGAGWGRRGGRRDYHGATTPRGPGATGGPHARPQMMTTGSLPRSNKRESGPRAPEAPSGHPSPKSPAAKSPHPSRLQVRAQVRGCPPRGAGSGRARLPRKTSILST